MILVLACDRAVPDNRIGITRSGEPVVHYRFTPEVVNALVAATRASARIFFAAGALRVHAPSADPPLLEAAESGALEERIHPRHFQTGRISISAAHLMGGAGMGSGPADSVTDPWGRVHGRPWLRVADASLFPDALEINPYLTIMALADRVAEAVTADLPALA
jgi:choline dehydrogenase-like flavoprotein